MPLKSWAESFSYPAINKHIFAIAEVYARQALAGRELDEEVHIHAMNAKADIPEGYPYYSIDVASALRVAEMFSIDRWFIGHDKEGFHIRETLCVTHHTESGETHYAGRPLASAPTLPLAICRAALILVLRGKQ